MQRIKRIDIPKPCHESWDAMTPVEQGRHCQSCCKTVIDFTTMPNADVIAYLSSHKNTCGRITGSKMASVNHDLEVQHRKRFTWKGFIAAASLSMLFPMLKAEAQSPPKTEQAPVAPNFMGKVAAPDTAGYITVKGVVTAKDDGLPVPGATIKVKNKGTYLITQTRTNGSFTIQVPPNTKRISVSFLGYETNEIKLRHKAGEQSIVLNTALDSSFAGGMEVYVNF
nr:carboxypeptidase-like regulatory domain-containing protein [uncultured Mucilaginibacter sp.]